MVTWLNDVLQTTDLGNYLIDGDLDALIAVILNFLDGYYTHVLNTSYVWLIGIVVA